jgi:hypothetical protein
LHLAAVAGHEAAALEILRSLADQQPLVALRVSAPPLVAVDPADAPQLALDRTARGIEHELALVRADPRAVRAGHAQGANDVYSQYGPVRNRGRGLVAVGRGEGDPQVLDDPVDPVVAACARLPTADVGGVDLEALLGEDTWVRAGLLLASPGGSAGSQPARWEEGTEPSSEESGGQSSLPRATEDGATMNRKRWVK